MRARAATITITIVLLLAGFAFCAFRWLDRKAQPTRDLSKMVAVRTVVAPALSAYYEKNKEYPARLSDLPLQSLAWGDERSSAHDLESWTYTSERQSFEMVWEGPRNLKVYLGGMKGNLFYSEDEKR